MRRALLIPAGVAVVVIVALLATSGGNGGMFRVDAVFDTAKGIVPGQLVKIAGARVGSVSDVKLIVLPNAGYQARMELSIDRRFEPFHPDASCQILPEGLISENFVECSPGTAGGSLAPGSTGVPTVPVTHTATPLSLQDVINVFSLPTSQQLGLVLNELGIGTAGRGEDFNQLLQRANPALSQARHVLSIIDAQTGELVNATQQTDGVLARLAGGDRQVREFVDNAATVARTTAVHSTALGMGIQHLPATLRAIDGAMKPIDRVTASGSPLLDELRAAAPGLQTFTSEFPRFAHNAEPALTALGAAADRGLQAIGPAQPVFAHLANFATQAPPVAKLLDDLLVSMRDRGTIELALRLIYEMAVVDGNWDSISHFVTVTVQVNQRCIAENAIGQPGPGCSHSYSAPDHGRVPNNDTSFSPGPLSAAITHAPGSPLPSSTAKPLSTSSLRLLLNYILK